MPTSDAPGPATLQPGSSFGRYVVDVLLGTGGMGQVYRAQDTRLHRPVAVKLLVAARSDAAAWKEATARMLREARAAAAFEHPNAVHIYDVGEIDGTPYIAMELVRGRPLRDYVGDASIPWETRLRWLADVAAALGAAHEAGLVHRDVKPRNVMVRDDGRVKVLDFGIARRIGGAVAASDDPTITTEGLVVGTMHYMPPEQLAGGPLDGRADQFAWGVMAYELLSGERPWPRQADLVATVTAILSTAPPPLDAVAPFVPGPVSDAVGRAISKLAPERFDTMGEIVAALEPYAQAAHPRGSTGRMGLGSSSSQRAASVAGDSDAMPASSLPTVQTKSARGVTVEPARPAKPRVVWPWLAGGLVVAVASLGTGAYVSRARGHAATPAPSSSASASAAVSLLDLPPPASTSALALTAYREGVQADHDANSVVARADFLEAMADDPGLGAAQLRFAIDDFTNDVGEARAHFLKAQQLRASLGDHERVVMDALAPLFDESPPSWADAGKGLEAAVAAHPADAELRYLLGLTREQEGKLPEAFLALDAATTLDPRYAAPLETRVQAKQIEGDVPGVIAATDACLKAVPSASGCLRQRLWTDAQEGLCTDYERGARRILAIDPGNAEAYEDLGQLVLAQGKPVDGAWELLRMGWKRQTADYAPWVEADDRARTAAATGDLAGFRASTDVLAHLNEGRTDQWSHFELAELLVNGQAELGAPDKAGQTAADYLGRKAAWTMEPGVNPFTVASDDTPLMLAAMLRAGRITRTDLDARRDEWLDAWRKRLTPEVARYMWILAYAEIADTPADAALAFEKLPAFGAIPRHRPWRSFGARIGRAYLLAGKPDEALPLLERAASECEPFEEPFTWVQTSLWLGQAREAKGLTDEACEAYGRVVKQWAGLGGKSVSVAEAKKRMGALKCASGVGQGR